MKGTLCPDTGEDIFNIVGTKVVLCSDCSDTRPMCKLIFSQTCSSRLGCVQERPVLQGCASCFGYVYSVYNLA